MYSDKQCGCAKRKEKTARLSIFSNSLLIVMKVIVGVMTGSVSIISEAIHSMMDLLAAVIAYVSVRIAEVPPDIDHPYGHEKIENVSGVIEAVLIFVAAIIIIYEAGKKIVEQQPLESIGLGFVVMIISAIINTIVARKLYKVAKEEDSVALEADALHLKVDVYTSLGVGVGLFLIWITGFTFLDPILAILIALFILKESYDMLKNAFNPLLDMKLEDRDVKIIEDLISKYETVVFDVHALRTRKSGKTRHIDFHITVPPYMTVKEAHDICDRLEFDIEKSLSCTKVLIHVEPVSSHIDV